MSLRTILKKAGLTLGSILLSCNIGCNSLNYQNTNPTPINLEEKVSKPKRLKAWQYPVNILGGYFLTAVEHESSHILTGAFYDAKFERLEVPYEDGEGNTYACAVIWNTYPEIGSTEDTMIKLAGPLGQRLFVETINYNLRNGKISQKYQPFWATTSLIARYLLLDSVAGALQEKKDNDFYIVSENTGIKPETLAGIVLLDVALNSGRIAKELKVALGRDIYQTREQKSRVDLIPTQNGINLTYTRNF